MIEFSKFTTLNSNQSTTKILFCTTIPKKHFLQSMKNHCVKSVNYGVFPGPYFRIFKMNTGI